MIEWGSYQRIPGSGSSGPGRRKWSWMSATRTPCRWTAYGLFYVGVTRQPQHPASARFHIDSVHSLEGRWLEYTRCICWRRFRKPDDGREGERRQEGMDEAGHCAIPPHRRSGGIHSESSADDERIAVQLDDPVDGAEEWDNEVNWYRG